MDRTTLSRIPLILQPQNGQQPLNRLHQRPDFTVQFQKPSSVAYRVLGKLAAGNGPARTFPAMHPATTIGHLEVLARQASGTTVRAAKALHGVSHDFAPVPPV